MSADSRIVFINRPVRTFFVSLVTLHFSAIILALGIGHRSPTTVAICAPIVLLSMFSIYHSSKWIYRMCREYLS